MKRSFLSLLAATVFFLFAAGTRAQNTTNPICGTNNDTANHVPGATSITVDGTTSFSWHDIVNNFPAVGHYFTVAPYGCPETVVSNFVAQGTGTTPSYALTNAWSADDCYIIVQDPHQGISSNHVVAYKDTTPNPGPAKSCPFATGTVVLTATQMAGPGRNSGNEEFFDTTVPGRYWYTHANILDHCDITGLGTKTCSSGFHTFSEYSAILMMDYSAMTGPGTSAGWVDLVGQNGTHIDVFTYNVLTNIKNPPYTTTCTGTLSDQPACTGASGTTNIHKLALAPNGGINIQFTPNGNSAGGTTERGNWYWGPPFSALSLEEVNTDHDDMLSSDVTNWGGGNIVGAYESFSDAGSPVNYNSGNGNAPCTTSGFRASLLKAPAPIATSCLFDPVPFGTPNVMPADLSTRDYPSRPWIAWQAMASPGGGGPPTTTGLPPNKCNTATGYADPSSSNWFLSLNELWLVRVDAANSFSKIWRMGLTLERGSCITDTTGNFYADPRGPISPDGMYLAFSTNARGGNAGLSNGQDNVDTVVLGPMFNSAGCTGSGTSWVCVAGALPSDVNTAMSSATDGFTITFQPGAYTFNASMPFSLTKGGTLICQSPGTCVITPSGAYNFGIPTWAGSGQYFTKLYRISGFKWNMVPNSIPIYWGNTPSNVNEGVFTQIQIDNNTFSSANTNNATPDVAIKMFTAGHRNYFYGVIGRNTMTCAVSCALLQGSSAIMDPQPPPNPLGTGNNLFVEDNTFTNGSLTASNDGEGILDWDYGTEPLVIRHNSYTDGLWTSHYTLENYEFYNNAGTFDANTTNHQDCYRAMHAQTSSLGHLFNNTLSCLTGPNTVVFSYGSIREGYKVDPRPWPITLKCTGFVNHSPFSDGNLLPSQTNQGYPCLFQPGRDQATENLAPFGVWNNTKNGALAVGSFEDFGFGQNPDYYNSHEQANREYYNGISTTAQSSPTAPWNCTTNNTGMAFGPLANQPTGCAAYTGEAGGGFLYAAHTTNGTIGANSSGGVASDDVLYQFGASGWTQIYKPYAYPHPLFTGTAQAVFPVFSVAPGAYTATQNVQVTTTSPSPTLYCTQDGSPPTHASPSYTGATYPPTFSVSSTRTINCLAASGGLLDSLTLSGGYYINATASNAWPTQPGSYPSGTLVVQINNPGQLVRNCVSTNGVDPTESSPGTCSVSNVCTGCALNGVNQFSTVTLSANGLNIIKFITSGAGFTHSPVTTVQYNIGGTNGLWWEDVGGANFAIGGNALAEDFGSQTVGTTSGTLPIYLNNIKSLTGTSTAPTTATSITSIVVAGTGFARANGDQCGTGTVTINAGNYCSILLTFTPPSNGTFNGTVTLTDTAPGSPHVINLTGTGVGGTVNLTPTTLAFSSQNINTTSAAQFATLTNTGSAPVNVTGVSVTGNFSRSGGTCTGTSFTLAVSASCTIGVTFTPTAVTSYNETLVITDNAPGSPHTTSLTGTGISPVAATLTPATIAFGNQNINTTSGAQFATLTNTGSVSVNVNAVTVTGNFSRSGGTCTGTSFTLAVGASCTFGITFSPTATISYNGTLAVSSDAPGSPQTVALTGQGTQATITLVSPQGGTAYSFGSFPVGSFVNSSNLTLQNTGTGPLNVSLSVGGTNPAQFSIFSTTCAGTLAASTSCVVVIRFTPAAATSYAALLTETDTNASNSPQSLTLSGSGFIPVVNPVVPWPPIILQ